ncbi:MAG: DUF2804 family protein [Treponema sp.]|nr:DUF2804 family protein [Treponema sp.]
MYKREMTDPPAQLIADGKPQFGTFSKLPTNMDIKGVRRPFRVFPLPTFITNLRIRCSINISISTEDFVGTLFILDAKFFSYSELIFWKRSTNQKFSYRHVSGIRRRVVPKNLEKAGTTIRSKRRYIRIRWNKEKNTLSVLFNMTGDSIRPSFSGSFLIDSRSQKVGQIFSVMPAPTTARCTALAQIVSPIIGTLFFESTDQPILPYEFSGSMFFNIRRAYEKLRSKHEQLTGIGKINDDNIFFQIGLGSASSIDANKFNENVLFVNDEPTPLPPVVITYPYGIDKKWIIQDTENMIDLSFTPISANIRNLSIFILRSKHHTIYGKFNGVLLTKEGKSISLKDFTGIVNVLRIRF